MTTPFELIALFDSLAPLYPGGVPKDLAAPVENPGPNIVVHGSRAGPLVCLGYAASNGELSLLSGASGSLLEAALSKGLKLDPGAAAYAAVRRGASSDGVAAALKGVRANVGLAFGEAAALIPGLVGANTWVGAYGIEWRAAPDLGAVAADPGLKRALWVELQEAAAKLKV